MPISHVLDAPRTATGATSRNEVDSVPFLPIKPARDAADAFSTPRALSTKYDRMSAMATENVEAWRGHCVCHD